ncbi:MAG: cyclodeaminase/cyclohydrolase family protein [Lachnospiraceae bacterium]|nr:cyclodeaminase/cyclohydrolase family protein [Lachnospiraceae bacterium]
MFADQKMNEFTKALSSNAPVPGGGGASAYVGALGMCLGSMVANLTTGKKKYAEYQAEIDQILEKSPAITDGLLECMDKDAEAFEPLSKAYGLPKNTPLEIAERDKIMAKALKEASEAPLYLMEKIMESIEILDRLSVIGSRIAISDVGVGVQFAKAALNGASLNVFINTKLMKDRELAEKLNHRANELIEKGNSDCDRIFAAVKDSLV